MFLQDPLNEDTVTSWPWKHFVDEIEEMEKIILRSLDYDISIPSPVLFLQRKLASLSKVPPLLKPLSTYLLDLGLVASQLPASASQAAFGALLCAASILQVFRKL